MNASVYRPTRFELRSMIQGPNHFSVQCSPRDQTPDVVIVDGRERLQAKRGPQLDLHESLFTEDEMATIHKALAILESAYAMEFDGHAASPERSVELIEQALAAKKEHEALTAESDELRKQNAALAKAAAEMQQALADLELAKKREEAERLDAELAAKKAALAADKAGAPPNE